MTTKSHKFFVKGKRSTVPAADGQVISMYFTSTDPADPDKGGTYYLHEDDKEVGDYPCFAKADADFHLMTR